MKRSEVSTFPLRVPVDVRRWLEQQCARNTTSLSAEVTIILRARMDLQEKAGA